MLPGQERSEGQGEGRQRLQAYMWQGKWSKGDPRHCSLTIPTLREEDLVVLIRDEYGKAQTSSWASRVAIHGYRPFSGCQCKHCRFGPYCSVYRIWATSVLFILPHLPLDCFTSHFFALYFLLFDIQRVVCLLLEDLHLEHHHPHILIVLPHSPRTDKSISR
jgi:hypothetical protein